MANSRTFKSIFIEEENPTNKVPRWRVKGSGVHGEPTDAPLTDEIVRLLKSSGITVRSFSMDSPVNVTSHHLEAKFEDGGLYAATGGYWQGECGTWITGIKAVTWLAKILGLNKIPLFTPPIADESMDTQCEDGWEYCPICDRLNSPGAVDYCNHYLGSLWEGEIIWSTDFEEFDTVYHACSEIIQTMEEMKGEVNWLDILARDVTHLGIPEDYIMVTDIYSYTASRALLELVSFTYGPEIVTDGMLGGVSYSLYHENSSAIRDVTAIYQKLLNYLSRTASQLQ